MQDIIERLMNGQNENSGCNDLYLRVLKSDVTNLLNKYMDITDIHFNLTEKGREYNLSISIDCSQFFSMGKNVD